MQFTDQKQNEEQIPYSSSMATILMSNFLTYVRVTKELHLWHNHASYLTWIQFTDWMEIEDQNFYLKFFMGYWLQTLSKMLGWQKNYIHDTIMVVTWLRYNLQTRQKIRTRFDILSFLCNFDLKIFKVMIIKKIVNSCWGWIQNDLMF